MTANIENVKRLNAADYPLPETFRCLEIVIPDDDSYIAVIAGFVALLSNEWSWVGSSDVRKSHADLWEQAYSLTEWEACMDCAEVADCIETDEGVQSAIRDVVSGTNPFAGNEVGQPVSQQEFQSNQAAGTNPSCNYDILWAQCLFIVQSFNRNITDTLEDIEVATNVVEILDVLEDLPLVKYLANLVGASAAIEAINYFQNCLLEQYLAEYDVEYENDLACALFCAAFDTCDVSIELLYDVFASRVVSLIEDPDTIETIVNLVEVVAGLEFDNTIVVDLAFFFCAASWKLGNFIFGNAASQTFKVLLGLAVDDASSDWSLLCECGWESIMDFTTDDFGFVPTVPDTGSFGHWTNGIGWEDDFGVDEGNSYRMVQVALTIDSASIRFMQVQYDLANGQNAGLPRYLGTNVELLCSDTAVPPDGTGQIYECDGSIDAVTEISFRVQSGNIGGQSQDPGGSVTVTRLIVRGVGEKPPQLP